MSTVPTPIPRGHARPRLTQVLVATLVVLVAIGVALLLAGRDWSGSSSSSTTQGSGVGITQTRTLPAFTKIDLAGDNRVTVHVGKRRSVVVHADDNLIDRVTTNVRAGSLDIAEIGSFAAKSPMSVHVTVPALDAVTLSGSGIIEVDGVDADDFVVRMRGSGIVAVRGEAERLDASLSGSGDVQLQGLTARDAAAGVSGSGRLQIYATATLDAWVSGSGAIFYSGNPTVTQRITGTGVILPQ